MSLTKQHSELLELLGNISEKYPGLRFMQLIGNTLPVGDNYFIRDEELIKALRKYYVRKLE